MTSPTFASTTLTLASVMAYSSASPSILSPANAVRFLTVVVEATETTSPHLQSAVLNAKKAMFVFSLVALSPGNLCEHDIEVGECSGVFVRFGYDKSTNDCRQFTYGGCGGNGNNFATIQECRNVCVKKVCNPNPQCDLTRCQIVNDRNGCPFCSCPPTNQPMPPGTLSSSYFALW
ncbi:Kunitz/Bovine pancreatic trypsin inhibitor domain protein [Cooperia oncophora]